MKKVKRIPKNGIHPNTIKDLINIKSAKTVLQKSQSKLFFSIGLCISLLLIITSFEFKFYNSDNIIDLGKINTEFENIIEVPATEQYNKPPPRIVQPKIIEVSDEKEIFEEIEIDLDIELVEEQVIKEPVYLKEDFEIEEESAEEIFTIVEQQPQPKGGYKVFYKFIGENLIYPSMAQRHNIEGRVYVQFVVEKDGSLTDFNIVKGIGGNCDEEALRILRLAPDWNPGKQRGIPVRVKMILPIHFQLITL